MASFEWSLVRHPFVGALDLHDDPVGDLDRCARPETDWSVTQIKPMSLTPTLYLN